MKSIKYFGLILFTVIVASCSDQKKSGRPLEIGYQNSPVAALLMIAKDKGYFDSVGLKVNMHSFTAGKFAVADLTSGKGVDIALSGDLPIVYTRLQGYSTRIISQVVGKTTNECRIIARKDENITTPEEYFSKPRTIVTSKKGTPEYFLHLYINKHHLDTTKITIKGMKPEDMPAAMINESSHVDAICIFDPAASIATRDMGEKAIVFQDSNMYSALYIVSVLQETLDTRKADLIKFLEALKLAANYCKENSENAKEIVAKYTGQDKDIVDALWGHFVFEIALTKDLPNYLHDEAEWAKASGDTTFKQNIPAFETEVIDTSLLHAVMPQNIRLHD